MKIITEIITIDELRELAKDIFVDMVKAVVDVERKVMAVNAELHSDLEAFLLKNGSTQKDLWGINLYLDVSSGDFVEFDSMINVRPSQNNRSRGVEDEATRKKIIQLVDQRVKR